MKLLVNLLRSITEPNKEDRLELEAIAQAFSDILFAVQEHCKMHLRFVHVSVRLLELELQAHYPFYTLSENLEDLCGICFSWKNIAQLFGISRWTNLSPSPVLWLANMQQFSVLSDAEIDEIVVEYLS